MATAGKIQALLNNTREKPVSKKTVKRQLASSELNARLAVSKPLLRSQNKRKRLLWAKKYKHYTVDDWKKVLFTHQSKVQLCGNRVDNFMSDAEVMKEC